MKFIEQLSKQSRLHMGIASAALVLAIGFIHFISGTEVAFSIFYLIPVCAAAWFVGRRAGIGISLFCGLIWLLVEILNCPRYSHPFIPYWNALVRCGIFLISSTLISEIVARKEIEKQLRQAQKELEAQVRERTAELERNQILERQVLEISEREQRRMGQDLHDGLCQHLVSVAFAAAVLRDRLAEKNMDEAADADGISDMLSDGLTQARNLARGLYPVRLEVDGLASALEEFAGNFHDVTRLACQFHCQEPLLIRDLTAGANLYRIAQESAFNAFKHAEAQNVSIELSAENNEVKLSISDDGKGFPVGTKNLEGMGLHIMRYRAQMIGATLEIRPGKTAGTQVLCTWKNAATAENHHANVKKF